MSREKFEDSSDREISEEMRKLGVTGAEELMQVAHGIVEEERIPIVEEQQNVGKGQVESDGARVSTHLTETLVQEQVGLRGPPIEDQPPQGALFEIEGPDEDGCVWICSAKGRGDWCRNLGPADKVAEVLSQWLASIDDGESGFSSTQDA